MTIYVTASIGDSSVIPPVRRVISYFERAGHTVYQRILSEHLPSTMNVTARQIQDWSDQWDSYITTCDIAVIEGSYPSSIHIGFEIGAIAMRSKPIVLIYQEDRDPIFIHTQRYNRLIKSSYTEKNLDDVIDWCMKELEHVVNRRFTFFVSPDIDTYLSTVVEERGMNRSEYIRGLIEQDRKHQFNKKL